MTGILTYHSIDDSGSVISTDEACFRRHVEWLASGKVRVLDLQALLSEPGDRNAVALTFDDAFVNFGTVAWPLLRQHRLPVTLFVPVGHVGASNRWPGEEDPGIPILPLLDWNALGRLAEEGVILGSHSRTHRDLRKLDDGDLGEELEGAAETIRNRTGRRPFTFAYPYGFHDERVVARVGTAYEAACTTELRTLGPREDRRRLPRLDAYYLRRPGLLESWGSRRLRWSLGLRHAARGLRQRFNDLRSPRD